MKNISIDLKSVKKLQKNLNIENENCTENSEKSTPHDKKIRGKRFFFLDRSSQFLFFLNIFLL